jgi:ubiquinone/menaquinone biosynthesis C-methylase UbiE
MNRSHFTDKIRNGYGVDFEKLWRDSMKSKDEYSRKRAFDDKTETQFWEKFSEKYDHRPSLYDYAPEVLDRIVSLTGHNKKMVEIGCGTGKFTLPMLSFAKEIIALDFSAHMLKKLETKLQASDYGKITLKQGKWEDVTVPVVGCIYSINAIYRMMEIKKALKKMNDIATDKVVLVWTMQRSIYDTIINSFHHKGLERRQEYIHLMNLLYELGIDANLEFLDVVKPLEMSEDRLRKDLLSLSLRHDLPLGKLENGVRRQSVQTGNTIKYGAMLKVAYIHWTPIK